MSAQPWCVKGPTTFKNKHSMLNYNKHYCTLASREAIVKNIFAVLSSPCISDTARKSTKQERQVGPAIETIAEASWCARKRISRIKVWTQYINSFIAMYLIYFFQKHNLYTLLRVSLNKLNHWLSISRTLIVAVKRENFGYLKFPGTEDKMAQSDRTLDFS